MKFGALEKHVFEQVCHPGFAVTFVPRTYEDRAIDGHFGLASILKQQDFQSVFQSELGDSLDRGNFFGHFVVCKSVCGKADPTSEGQHSPMAYWNETWRKHHRGTPGVSFETAVKKQDQ